MSGPGRRPKSPILADFPGRCALGFGYLITLPVGTDDPKNFKQLCNFFGPIFGPGGNFGSRKIPSRLIMGKIPVRAENSGKFRKSGKNRGVSTAPEKTPFFCNDLNMDFGGPKRGRKKVQNFAPRGPGISRAGPGAARRAKIRDFRGSPRRRPKMAIFGGFSGPEGSPGPGGVPEGSAVGRAFLLSDPSGPVAGRRRYAASCSEVRDRAPP